MAKFRKKPVEIEAVQFTQETFGDAIRFVPADCFSGTFLDSRGLHMVIRTLEGDMRADEGDFIIKGVQGEFYPCKPDIFFQTYEAVEGE